MNRFAILVLCSAVLICSCSCTNNSKTSDLSENESQSSYVSNENEASSTENESSSQSSSSFLQSLASEEAKNNSGANNASSIQYGANNSDENYYNELIKLQDEYNATEDTLNKEYYENLSSVRNIRVDCSVKISDIRSNTYSQVSSLSSQINALERDQENAYAQACARTGGMPNSYAYSLRTKNQNQIDSLKTQIQQIENNAAYEINRYQQMLNSCPTEEQLTSEYESNIAQIKANYNAKVDALNKKYNR